MGGEMKFRAILCVFCFLSLGGCAGVDKSIWIPTGERVEVLEVTSRSEITSERLISAELELDVAEDGGSGVRVDVIGTVEQNRDINVDTVLYPGLMYAGETTIELFGTLSDACEYAVSRRFDDSCASYLGMITLTLWPRDNPPHPPIALLNHQVVCADLRLGQGPAPVKVSVPLSYPRPTVSGYAPTPKREVRARFSAMVDSLSALGRERYTVYAVPAYRYSPRHLPRGFVVPAKLRGEGSVLVDRREVPRLLSDVPVLVSVDTLGIEKEYTGSRHIRFSDIFADVLAGERRPAAVPYRVDVEARLSRGDFSDTLRGHVVAHIDDLLSEDLLLSGWEVVSEVSMDPGWPSPGIGNGRLDAGERIEMLVDLRNASSNYYVSTSAFFESEDRHVDVRGYNIRYDEILPGESTRSPQPIVMEASPETPHGYVLAVDIVAEDSAYKRKIRIPFRLSICNLAPVLFERAVVDDDNIGGSRGDADGVLEVGETVEFIVFVENTGKEAREDVVIRLMPSPDSAPYVEMIEDEHTYERIASGGEAAIPVDYDFRILPSAGRAPRTLRFTVEASSNVHDREGIADPNWRYKWTDTFEIAINTPDTRVKKLEKQ
jgi:hypothetical protein